MELAELRMKWIWSILFIMLYIGTSILIQSNVLHETEKVQHVLYFCNVIFLIIYIKNTVFLIKYADDVLLTNTSSLNKILKYMYFISNASIIVFMVMYVVNFGYECEQTQCYKVTGYSEVFSLGYNNAMVIMVSLLLLYYIFYVFFPSCICLFPVNNNIQNTQNLDSQSVDVKNSDDLTGGLFSLVIRGPWSKSRCMIVLEKTLILSFSILNIFLVSIALIDYPHGLQKIQYFSIVFHLAYSIFAIRMTFEGSNTFRFFVLIALSSIFAIVSCTFDVITVIQKCQYSPSEQNIDLNNCFQKNDYTGNYYQYILSVFNILILCLFALMKCIQLIVKIYGHCNERARYQKLINDDKYPLV
ncbi:MAG: hypothetical protein Terrestrivirus9_3 [Terrestrivirus sp.]|uniref:Transmembrane protein n=1 Tax=Terrestrivirus sp. TaxID=2487775 RepID=A0A3G4ZNW0_9VIRU|nr:MAG: hypothetical protein Terrestrivirus9_3 [Terrestrivirus sp.]